MKTKKKNPKQNKKKALWNVMRQKKGPVMEERTRTSERDRIQPVSRLSARMLFGGMCRKHNRTWMNGKCMSQMEIPF